MPFTRLMPLAYRGATFGSVATNSSAREPVFVAPVAGEVVGGYIINSTSASIASGTTTGSAASIVVYINASGTGSRIATFNGSGTNVATAGSAALVITSNANARLAAGDSVIGEFIGGAANNASNAGCFIQVHFVYGRDTGGTPAAGTGPA